MTIEEIYQLSLAFINASRDDNYYKQMVIPLINVIAVECFNKNNLLRIDSGKPALQAIPIIKKITDSLDYEEILEMAVIPYGLAGGLIIFDNPSMATMYKNKYVYELNTTTKAVFTSVDDYYGGDSVGV